MTKPWTENDLAILAEHSLAGKKREVTAAVLERSVAAVITKASNLGLKKIHNTHPEDRLRDRWRLLLPKLKNSLLSDLRTAPPEADR